MRATCLRCFFSALTLSSWPVTFWKRSLNSASFTSASSCTSAASSRLRYCLVLGHQNASSRATKRALIGSFWMARSMASRASTGSG